MRIKENELSLDIDVEMTRAEVEEGLLLSIMKNSGKFLPHKISETNLTIPETVTIKLKYRPRGS